MTTASQKEHGQDGRAMAPSRTAATADGGKTAPNPTKSPRIVAIQPSKLKNRMKSHRIHLL
uniref:Uncharacterized protein n=1 Tax=Arundo donax TaxID=35708 RepID=A0A0A8Z5N8_ARUDO